MITIPHSRPTLGPEETEMVSRVIDSAHIAQGKVTRQFEHAFASKIGAPYAVSTNSGTAALHLTLLAMKIGPGDEVIMPSYVCSALLNAVHYVRAVPVLAEICPETCNLDLGDVKKRLTNKTRAVIVPHMFGMPADISAFPGLGVPVIEDCAQAAGSLWSGKQVGTFGYASVFSFYATKVMTTGEGGMVVSGSEELIERIRDLKEYDGKKTCKVRFNYKMTDIQAAMGLVQLKRLPWFIKRRKEIAQHYYEHFASADFRVPPRDPGHIYYRYVIDMGKDSEQWIKMLLEKGVHCARPVHLPLHRCLDMKGFSRTEMVWRNSLSLPIYPSLSEENADQVIRAIGY